MKELEKKLRAQLEDKYDKHLWDLLMKVIELNKQPVTRNKLYRRIYVFLDQIEGIRAKHDIIIFSGTTKITLILKI